VNLIAHGPIVVRNDIQYHVEMQDYDAYIHLRDRCRYQVFIKSINQVGYIQYHQRKFFGPADFDSAYQYFVEMCQYLIFNTPERME